MPKKKRKRVKHIPQRICASCQQVASKRSLIRIVRSQNGIAIDPTGKVAGRGVYLHKNRECWTIGLQGTIARALKTELNSQEMESLISFLEKLQE